MTVILVCDEYKSVLASITTEIEVFFHGKELHYIGLRCDV